MTSRTRSDDIGTPHAAPDGGDTGSLAKRRGLRGRRTSGTICSKNVSCFRNAGHEASINTGRTSARMPPEPKTMAEAKASPEWSHWDEAMDQEMTGLIKSAV